MNKLTNAVVFIIIGLVFATVVVSSVSTYQYNANGWDIYTRETVRGSGVSYAELFSYNELTNGDFDSTDDWDNVNMTFNINNGVAELTASAQYARIYQELSLIKTHKYYIYSYVRTTSTQVIVDLSNGSDATVTLAHSGSGKYELLSGYLTQSSNTLDFTTLVMDVRVSSFDKVYVDYIGIIDLTDIYGSGIEPTITQLNSYYADYQSLSTRPNDTLKTLDGMVELFPILFIIIIVAGAVLFIKTKES